MNNRVFTISLLGLVSGVLAVVAVIATGNRNTSVCQANLKQVGLALLQYCRDYDEKMVLSHEWKTELMPYIKRNIFDCPAANFNYAFNRHASGISYSEISDHPKFVSFFDSSSTLPNAADFGTSYPTDGAHSLWRRGRGTNVAFLDGHVKWMQQKPVFEPISSPAPVSPIQKPKAKAKSRQPRVSPAAWAR